MESRVNDQSVGLGSRLLLGALAGMAGTAAMTAAMNRLHQRLPPKDRYPLPPREITERMLGSQSEAALKDKATAAHLGYGAVTGARSEERRVGKECVSTGRSRGSTDN